VTPRPERRSDLGAPVAFYPVTVDNQTTWTSGDLDENGAVDLLVVDGQADTLTFLLSPPSLIGQAATDDGIAVAAALMDADTDLDLVVVRDSDVGVRGGDGAGGFGPPVWSAVGYGVPGDYSLLFDAQAHDLNGDDITDLVVTGWDHHCPNPSRPPCGDTGWEWVFLGNGAGSFAPRVAATAGFGELADFDEDGKVDLASNGTNEVLLYSGDGSGLFSAPAHIPTAFPVCGTASADMDGDGHADLVTGIGKDQGRILLGDGAGGFPATRSFVTAGAAADGDGDCVDTMTVDLDGDGKPDVVTLSDAQNRLAVLLNRL
jgi:hypothetical protein